MIKNDERYMAVVVLKNILHEEELEASLYPLPFGSSEMLRGVP